ncbi:MAG: hypothetical protein FIB08_07260 [Candidatus Methanoperedens sp.]|nr:hypothetical protein [Candidatus Methanoperedens sp.]
MGFSIDTNVIIGVVNNKDRLHDISLNLMRDKQNEKLIICKTALKEAQTVFKHKINEIMVEIIQFLPKFFQNKKMNLLESQIYLIEVFKALRDQKPGLTNFLNLVYHDVSTFLQEGHGIEEIPLFLSQLALQYSNLAIPKLESAHPIEASISLNLKTLSGVKSSTKDIYFKDTYDERIFQELMTNLAEIMPIEFFSDDMEFKEKSEIGYAKITNDLGFDKQAFSFNSLERYNTKP